MEIALGRWSRPPLFPLSLQPLGQWWERKQWFFMNVWLADYLTAIQLRTAVLWPGWGAHSLFLCCALLQCAFVELSWSISLHHEEASPEMGHLDEHRNNWVPLFIIFFRCPAHMPTGAGGGGKGRPSSPGKKINKKYWIIKIYIYCLRRVKEIVYLLG